MELNRFTKYTLKTATIPHDLNLSSGIKELLQTSLEGYDFAEELKLISRYEDIKKFEISAIAESKAKGDNVEEDDPYDDSAFKSTPFLPQVSDHESKIMRMMEETAQDRDVCYFYLESTNWDIAEATKLLKNMSE